MKKVLILFFPVQYYLLDKLLLKTVVGKKSLIKKVTWPTKKIKLKVKLKMTN